MSPFIFAGSLTLYSPSLTIYSPSLTLHSPSLLCIHRPSLFFAVTLYSPPLLLFVVFHSHIHRLSLSIRRVFPFISRLSPFTCHLLLCIRRLSHFFVVFHFFLFATSHFQFATSHFLFAPSLTFDLYAVSNTVFSLSPIICCRSHIKVIEDVMSDS